MSMTICSYLILGLKVDILEETEKKTVTKYHEDTGLPYEKKQEFTTYKLMVRNECLAEYQEREDIFDDIGDNESLTYYDYNAYGQDDIEEFIIGIKVSEVDQEDLVQVICTPQVIVDQAPKVLSVLKQLYGKDILQNKMALKLYHCLYMN